MRIGWLVIVLAACGNTQATPTTASQPTATASAAPQPTATESATAAGSATATATATASAPPPAPTKTVGEVLTNAKIVKLTYRPDIDKPDTKSLDIKSAATIKSLIDLFGADQHFEGSGPGYMPTFEFKFLDKDENPLATVSLFSSSTMSDSNKKYGKINVADGTYGGIVVPKYEDLQKKLKTLGITLP